MPDDDDSSINVRKQHRRLQQQFDWTIVVSFVVMYVGAAFAPFHFTWSGLTVFTLLYFVTGCLGITLGYHRLLTHSSFKTPKTVRRLLSFLGCMAFMGGPLTWVGIHRIHHAFSDQEEDPHTPSHGVLWSHMLYAFRKHPPHQLPRDFARDLERDHFICWLEKWNFVPQVICFLLLYVLGEVVSGRPFGTGLGASWLLWGGFVRTVMVYNAAGLVNSATHIYGYQNFKTVDQSRNSWFIALLTFGEGWHNNHHAQQRSAAHGMKWWELDPTYWVIKLMKKVGLAWDVVSPRPFDLDDAQLGSEPVRV